MKLKTRTNQPVEGDELDNSLTLNGSLVAEGVYARDSKITGNLEVTGDVKLNGESALQKWEMTNETFIALGLTIDAIFTKVVRNFNELQFIFNCRISNNTESAISITNDTALCTTANEAIPNSIKEKIYAHNGQKLSEVDANQSIAFCPLFVSQPTGASSTTNMPRYANLFYIKAVDALRMYLSGGNISIPANTTYDLEARISLAI